MDCAFLDYQKAFPTVPWRRMIGVLYFQAGIRRGTSSVDRRLPWGNTVEDTCQRYLFRPSWGSQWCPMGLILGAAAVPDLCG